MASFSSKFEIVLKNIAMASQENILNINILYTCLDGVLYLILSGEILTEQLSILQLIGKRPSQLFARHVIYYHKRGKEERGRLRAERERKKKERKKREREREVAQSSNKCQNFLSPKKIEKRKKAGAEAVHLF